MAFPRFFCAAEIVGGAPFRLPDAPAHHAARVLRLAAGHHIVLFDGRGGEFDARIESISKNGVEVLVGQHRPVERESTLDVTLVQSLCSGDRMDVVLQKSVELGVSRIQPVASRRSVVKLAGDRVERREQHWRGVVSAACEQCGRNRIPDVAPLQEFDRWLGDLPPGLECLLLDPEAPRRLSELPAPRGTIVLLAGPEGGFTPDERAAAIGRGCTPVRLGARVLRTETAAMAALAAMQARWGDF